MKIFLASIITTFVLLLFNTHPKPVRYAFGVTLALHAAFIVVVALVILLAKLWMWALNI